LNETLFRRRLRMARMLAMNISLHVVVETLSKEFGVSPRAIYKDHECMHVWSHAIEQDKQLTGILRARLRLLSNEALVLAMEGKESNLKPLTVKDKFVKIGAINSALKVTDREISLAQELGLIERKPLEVESTNRNLTVIRMWQPNDETVNGELSKVLPVCKAKKLKRGCRCIEKLKDEESS
jgi:hypothetical protein